MSHPAFHVQVADSFYALLVLRGSRFETFVKSLLARSGLRLAGLDVVFDEFGSNGSLVFHLLASQGLQRPQVFFSCAHFHFLSFKTEREFLLSRSAFTLRVVAQLFTDHAQVLAELASLGRCAERSRQAEVYLRFG